MTKPKLETMTVGELKKYLDEFPDHCPVVFSYPSGDHWRTELVGTVQSAEYGNVEYTGYHQCFQVNTPDDELEARAAAIKTQEVLVLG